MSKTPYYYFVKFNHSIPFIRIEINSFPIVFELLDPCFNSGESLTGLNRGDAEFVLAIHSNSGGLGKRDPIGKFHLRLLLILESLTIASLFYTVKMD